MGNIVSTGRGVGNISPPLPGTGNGGLVGGLIDLSWGRGGGMGGGFGTALQRLRRAGRKPGLPPPSNPDYIGLNQAGPNGEVANPETFYGGQRHPITGDRLSSMASAARDFNGMPNVARASTEGYGPGDSTIGSIRKLIQQRLGVVL